MTLKWRSCDSRVATYDSLVATYDSVVATYDSVVATYDSLLATYYSEVLRLKIQLELIAQRHLEDAVVIGRADILDFKKSPVVTGIDHGILIFVGDAHGD